MSNVRVQDIKRQQEIDMYMQAYYLATIGIGHFNPIFATAISVIVDYGINDTYYLLRDSKGFVPNGKTYSQISKEGLDVASHLFKMYQIANSKDAENEAAKDILTSLGSGIHYDIDNYDYLASYQICDPYIIQNIKTLEEEGLGRMLEMSEYRINKIANRIGYDKKKKPEDSTQTSDDEEMKDNLYYTYFIKGKSEADIEKYQKCYEKLLYGRGEIILDEIDPIILNNCLEEIQKKYSDDTDKDTDEYIDSTIDIKRELLEYGRTE